MNKCKLCNVEFKSEEDAKKHDGYCETCSKKVIKENDIVEKAKAKMLAEMEAKKAEDDKKAELEARAKKLAEEEFAKKMGGADDLNAEAAKKAAEDMAAAKSNRKKVKKMDDQSEEMYEALQTGKTLNKEYDLDINNTEAKIEQAKSMVAEGTKANLDGATSYGPDFVPEEWAPGFYFRLGSMHGNLMNIGFRKYGMNTDIKNIAEILTKPSIAAYSNYQNQNLAIANVTATDITTGTGTLTARRFVAKLNVYNTLLKDEKFGLMKGIKMAMADELSASVSSAILNGDDTATHMDEDYEAAGANIPEAMWKGLRKLTLANSLGVDGDSTYTLANLDSVQALMGKYAIGSNLRKAKWIMGIKTYNQLMTLWRSSTSTPQAADFIVANGYIQSYMGHQVIVSDKQREDLEEDGYQDETGTGLSQGFASLVNVDNFVLGIRDKMQIKVVDDPLNDRKQVQATLRMDFQPFETPSTTISTLAGLYAYTV